jgi:phospholipid-translocating ATPase
MSIVQGAVIMFVAITHFDHSFIHIVTITFTTLVVIEILNVFSTVTRVVWQMVVVTCIALFFYWGSIIMFKDYF